MKVKTTLLRELLEGPVVQFAPYLKARQAAKGGKPGKPGTAAVAKEKPRRVPKRTVSGEKPGTNWTPGSKMEGLPDIRRDDAIKRIRVALKRRTGRPWSVKGGQGTAWGWIMIEAPPKRRPPADAPGVMSEEDAKVLYKAMGLTPSFRGSNYINVPSGIDYYIEYVDRAEGRKPRVKGSPYWD